MKPEVAPYDALLLVSFGGPEKPEDVVPFLENVTAGRGIPRERLVEVGEHYALFGGRSPINDLNRDLLASIRARLEETGIDLPVYWGNRNWDPYLTDAVQQMKDDGIARAACFVTSAYSSWSSCRQYRENLFDAVAAVEGAPVLDKLRHYFNHPGFVLPVVDAVRAALAGLPEDVRDEAHLVFVTHSIPLAMAESVGSVRVARTSRSTATSPRRSPVGSPRRPASGTRTSSSTARGPGPPQVPWLEPDVNDHLETLAAGGAPAVVMVPIGFVSDHMEVVYDLDTEALATAERLGLPARAGRPPRGPTPASSRWSRDLLRGARRGRARRRGRPAARRRARPAWDRCAVGCCPNPRANRPALCGEDG